MGDLFGTPEIATQPPDALPAGEARPRGAYYTPDLLALAIVRTVATLIYRPGLRIFEPGCGGGAFLRAAHAVWPLAQLLGVDLVPACTGPGLVRTLDLFSPTILPRSFDLVIGNPDFGIAERVVRRGLELVDLGGYVALLLRLSFLESAVRVPLYRDHPLYAFQPIAQRASFTGGDVDQVGYGIYVWRRGHCGEGRILPPLEWRRCAA